MHRFASWILTLCACYSSFGLDEVQSQQNNLHRFRHRHDHQRHNGQALPPSKYGMRPAPSHDLPVLDLIEPPDKAFDPKPEDLDNKVLKEKMGKSYDPRFMSYKRPLDTGSLIKSNGTLELSYTWNKRGRLIPLGKMPKDIRHLDFEESVDSSGVKLRTGINKKLRKKFQQFLWQYSYCPVVYKWKHLSLRFWPRWIREGGCYSVPGKSCSIPAGMTCKASKYSKKNVLRWHCQNWDQAKYCKWIMIEYPVIEECSCSC